MVDDKEVLAGLSVLVAIAKADGTIAPEEREALESALREHPIEGLRNNVLGTWYLAKAAAKAGVGRFVLISSDKAVRPANVMGATKRMSELVVQMLSAQGAGTTIFSMVRFGNVLESSGSVVPPFQAAD